MTDNRTVVQVEDLRRACALLLDHVEKLYGTQVDLGHISYYWEVDLAAAFAPTGQPEEHLGCGHVTDDLAELAGVLTRPGDDVVTWHDLAHLAALMRCIAHLDHLGRLPLPHRRR